MRGSSVWRAALIAGASLSLRSPIALAEGVKIPYSSSKLPNGATLILHEDHALPIVVVNLWYHVGSRFEAVHRTGFAHLFEHLMFMGTRRVPTKMFDGWMEAAGGWNNATTSEDRTDFYDVGPANTLPLLIWLEADRLRDLGPLMTQSKLDAQREVVRNERRQTSENEPYGKVELRLPELLYPEGHPYHHPVIGSHEDLEAARVDDVKEFFGKWYDPANASIVIAGDFDPNAARALVKRDFGSIPSRGKPADPGAPGFEAGRDTSSVSSLRSVVRETIEDQVELPKVVMAWQSPKHFAGGDAELDLAANILAGGKASRLYKSLVYEKKIAQRVDASQESAALGSRFVVDVIARPGVSLRNLETAIDSEIAGLRRGPIVEEELTRAKNRVETAFVTRLESVRERALLLNSYLNEVGDPGYAEHDIERYRRATSKDITKVVNQVLNPNARVILHVIPKAALGKAAEVRK